MLNSPGSFEMVGAKLLHAGDTYLFNNGLSTTIHRTGMGYIKIDSPTIHIDKITLLVYETHLSCLSLLPEHAAILWYYSLVSRKLVLIDRYIAWKFGVHVDICNSNVGCYATLPTTIVQKICTAAPH